MNEPLVSVIVPVFNGAAFIDRFMKMILLQSYPEIELILVDDGSSDNSFQTASVYSDYFEEKGWMLKCLRQKHAGAAAALNTGLKSSAGVYLKWMDIDDLLEPDCIRQEADFLLSHPEYGFVICDSRYVDEDLKTIRVFGRTFTGKDDYFWDILRGTHNYSLGSGTILISRENLKRAIPDIQIYESPEGQNYQLMLPITYHFRCGYLRRPLFVRVVRNDSHSRRIRTYEEQKNRYYGFIELMKETVRRMEIPEEQEAFALIEKRFAHLLLQAAYIHYDPEEVDRCYALLRKHRDLSLKEIAKSAVIKHRSLYRLFRKLRGRKERHASD